MRTFVPRPARADNLPAAPQPAQDTWTSPGRPIEPVTRRRMESAFRQDFTSVRLHADGAGSRVARGLGARAAVRGEHVAFAEGVPALDTAAGTRLLAHELAHVVQQRRGGDIPPLAPGAAHEQDAAQAADAVAAGGQPSVRMATGEGFAREMSVADLAAMSLDEIAAEHARVLTQHAGRAVPTADQAYLLRLEAAATAAQRAAPAVDVVQGLSGRPEQVARAALNRLRSMLSRRDPAAGAALAESDWDALVERAVASAEGEGGRLDWRNRTNIINRLRTYMTDAIARQSVAGATSGGRLPRLDLPAAPPKPSLGARAVVTARIVGGKIATVAGKAKGLLGFGGQMLGGALGAVQAFSVADALSFSGVDPATLPEGARFVHPSGGIFQDGAFTNLMGREGKVHHRPDGVTEVHYPATSLPPQPPVIVRYGGETA